jgi:Fe-Mn family superoxide dismutase
MNQAITVKQFKPEIFRMTEISKTAVEKHLKLYEGYVKKVNEIREKLAVVNLTTANQTYSEIRELKLELSFALGGVRNHEIYFEHLGGQGGEPEGVVKAVIDRRWGNFDNWKKEMTAVGMAARGWAWLAYDWRLKNLDIFLGDSQNTYPIWDGSVAVALDTYEHAYWEDFGTNRAGYIEAFFNNLDWSVIETEVNRWDIAKNK